MFIMPKKVIIAFLLLLLLLVITFWFGRAYDLKEAKGQAEQQVTQLNHYIDNELARFSAIPQLLTKNSLLIRFTQGEAQHVNAINNYLADIQQSSGASDIYILNTYGDVVASSNWQSDYTFLGSNFSYRPYFKQAFAGEKVAYFALGQRSQERGIYFSQAIYADENVIGVVTLKINVGKLENDRTLLNNSQGSHFYLQLGDKIIAMSDEPHWRLNSFEALDISTRREIKQRRAYLEHQPLLIPRQQYQTHAITQFKIADRRYVAATKPLTHLNADMNVLVDVSAVNALQLPRLLWLMASYCVMIFVGYSLLARFAGYKKLLYSRQSLELEVIERTQTLEKVQTALVQSAKLATIGQLSAGINHEINQPLSAMNTYISSAKILLNKGKLKALSENLIIIESLIERVHKIVAQLKHFSKPSSMQLRPHPLSGLLNNALMITHPQLKQDKVNVSAPQFSQDIMVWVDALKFEQVLVNVITNASHAMKDEPNRDLSFDVECFEERVKLSILDSGPGIEHHLLGSIFEPFYSTKSSNGLGLGLSISKQIIDSFNGYLTAHNRPEGGAQFIISLSSTEAQKND